MSDPSDERLKAFFADAGARNGSKPTPQSEEEIQESQRRQQVIRNHSGPEAVRILDEMRRKREGNNADPPQLDGEDKTQTQPPPPTSTATDSQENVARDGERDAKDKAENQGDSILASALPDEAHRSAIRGTQPVLPRVVIKFCTQCRWMLKAAYLAQELISTFSTALGEVALQPSDGGVFQVHLEYAVTSPLQTNIEDGASAEKVESKQNAESSQSQEGISLSSIVGVRETGTRSIRLWDRKTQGGFPEPKVLKQLVRDHIEPQRDLGHSERGGKKKDVLKSSTGTSTSTGTETGTEQAHTVASPPSSDAPTSQNPKATGGVANTKPQDTEVAGERGAGRDAANPSSSNAEPCEDCK